MPEQTAQIEGLHLPEKMSPLERQTRTEQFLKYEAARQTLAKMLADKKAARIELCDEKGMLTAVVIRLRKEETDPQQMGVRFLFAVPDEPETGFKDNVYTVTLDPQLVDSYGKADPPAAVAKGKNCDISSTEFFWLQGAMRTGILSRAVTDLTQASPEKIVVTPL